MKRGAAFAFLEKNMQMPVLQWKERIGRVVKCVRLTAEDK